MFALAEKTIQEINVKRSASGKLPAVLLEIPSGAVPLIPDIPKKSTSSSSNPLQRRHRCVVMGGTFDHLHAGHKIMLNMAVFLAHFRVMVGISGEQILPSKAEV